MTAQTCALQGCDKPPWPSSPGHPPHLTCGNLHHQLLMASRFNPALPHPHQAILKRTVAGLCAFLPCEKPPYPGHAWCSRTHYLQWLDEFTSSLHPHQFCMLPRCPRHVFVDDNSPPSRFCGWRHQQKFVMLNALQRLRQEALPSAEDLPEEPPFPASLNENECGDPPFNSLLHSLKQFALFQIDPTNIRVIEDFYQMHPWEVFTERRVCWLIVGLKFTSKGRKLTTKDYYHWKQSGRRTRKSKYIVTYYTYTRRKGKEKEVDQRCAESLFTMKEFTLEDVKYYSLIQLAKEKPSNGKLGKGQPSKQRSNDQLNNACSQDTVISKLSFLNDDMSVDSIFRDLLPINDACVS